MTALSIKHIAQVFRCTEEQARDQLRANAENFRRMAAKAAGNKRGMHKGYSQAQLETYAHDFMSASLQPVTPAQSN